MQFQIGILIFILISENGFAQNGVKKCECVANNKCFPNLVLDSVGQIDVRIVNDKPNPVPPKPPCTNGLIQCCADCGVSYNITTALKPAEGEGRYGSQPWQAILLDNKLNYLGGGVLLDEKNILTAAHKIYELQKTPGNIVVRLGEWDVLNQTVEPYKPQESAVAKIFMHPSYKHSPTTLLNDVAILRLATPIKYGPTINPAINTACLPVATTNFTNLRCAVSGWGKNAFNGTYQAVIKEVEVPIVADAICETRLKTTTALGNSFVLDKKNFICAGGEPNKDACVGDGGSPLMCKVGDRYQLAGLVAWGIGCANGNIPGVYVRVQSFLDFINKSIASA